MFEQELNEAEREAAQRLLVRMVRPGEGVEDTRRRTALPVADAVAEATIRKLAAERLVVTERDAGSGAVTVEVAHEALIRRWQRLRDWVDRDRDFLRTRERIAAQAATWQDEGQPADRLLSPGRALEEGKELLATRGKDLETELVAYIEASVASAQAKQEVERQAQRRRLTFAWLAASAFAVLALLAAGLGEYAMRQRDEARRHAETALRVCETVTQLIDYSSPQVQKKLEGLSFEEIRDSVGTSNLCAKLMIDSIGR